jgi:hypothetical protein
VFKSTTPKGDLKKGVHCRASPIHKQTEENLEYTKFKYTSQHFHLDCGVITISVLNKKSKSPKGENCEISLYIEQASGKGQGSTNCNKWNYIIKVNNMYISI